MEKSTQIKVWPELVNYLPLLTSVSEASSPTKSLFLDFSGCSEVDSCGLTSELLKILHFMRKIDPDFTGVSWSIEIEEDDDPIIKRIIQLGFFLPIKDFFQPSLFHTANLYDSIANFFIIEDNIKQTSYNIYHLKLVGLNDRRKPLRHFTSHLLDILIPYESIYSVNTRQFITIIYELAKNAADHTNGDAYLGLDVYEIGNELKIQFLFGDTGVGIKNNIQSHLENEKPERKDYFSLVEAYYLACQKYFTSKPKTGRNLGVGMSTAIESSRLIGGTLSVFDANSRGVLSNLIGISHSEIRKNFYPASPRYSPFCYYGTIKAKKK